jgi:1-aminocyclopropane-1-carboxylate deaminase
MNPLYGGNKYFKLKKNIEAFYNGNYNSIISFGGAYSNHVFSLAALAKELKIKSLAYIRGLEPNNLTSTLTFANECGMELLPVSRTEYSQKNQQDFQQQLKLQHPNSLLVPEGGSNQLGIDGCIEITGLSNFDFDYVVLACGTGTTLAGVVSSLKENQKAIGISVLKGHDTLTNFVLQHNPSKENSFQVLFDYHFGGYAKSNQQLENFIHNFYSTHTLPLDRVYTAKAMAALSNLIQTTYFPPHSKILFLHTGGLQNGAMTI